MDALSNIDVVILTGGFGTRLRGVLNDRPKSLAVVQGRPFLAWGLDYLTAAGTRRAVLCTGFLGEMIQQEFGVQYGPMELCYSRETAPRGTGGALLDALPLVQSPTFLALNGDSLCLASLDEFVAEHRRRRARLQCC